VPSSAFNALTDVPFRRYLSPGVFLFAMGQLNYWGLIHWIERISGGTGVVAGWLVVPLIFATCYEVFSRYVLNAPTIWAYELGYMVTGANFLIGAAYALREKAHIRIDVIYAHFFSKRTQALINVGGYVLLFLPIMFWLTLALWDYAYQAYLTQELSGQSAWNPVIWPFRLVFFAGFLLLLLQGIAEVLKVAFYLAGHNPSWDPG
jgi:TRAP-type mannitol/chloroaromatic compound transport system permease small subunit